MSARGFAALAALACAALAPAAALAGPGKKQPPPPPPPSDSSESAPPLATVTDVKPFPAAGDKRRIIGILDVRVDGAPADVGAEFLKELEDLVDIDHYYLAPRARIREAMASSTRWTDGCVVGPCLQELRAQTNAQIALLASLTGSGTSFGWVITLVRTDTGNVLSQRAERCDVCTVDEALQNATRAAVDLFSAIPDELPAEHAAAGQLAPASAGEHQVASLHHARTATGIGLLASGLAVAAIGTIVYFVEHHDSVGLGGAGVGAGLVLGGAITLAF